MDIEKIRGGGNSMSGITKIAELSQSMLLVLCQPMLVERKVT